MPQSEDSTPDEGAPHDPPGIEFRAAGLLWWLNRILHTFGWSIVVGVDEDTDETVHAFPVRTGCLGFPDEMNERRLADFRKGLKQ